MTFRDRVSAVILRVLNATARNHEYRLIPKPGPRAGQLFEQGPLWTKANHDFAEDPDFERAYQRGVKACGWDFNIHWRVHVALWVAQAATRIPGDFVECGVGRGMVSSAVLESLDWDALGRRFLLIDSYIPYWVGPDGEQTEAQGVSDHYAVSKETVAANFAEWPRVELVEGRIPDVLSTVDVERVAYLHIDLNSAPPERASLEFFWPRMERGSFVLLDDYGFAGPHEVQKAAADEFAKSVGTSVLTLPTGQGLLAR